MVKGLKFSIRLSGSSSIDIPGSMEHSDYAFSRGRVSVRFTAGPAESSTATVPDLPGDVTTFRRPSVADVEGAVLRYAAEHFRCRRSFVRQMRIRDLRTRGVYIYKLETFGELRTKSKTSEAYAGSSIDGDLGAPPPGLWNVPASPGALFRDSETEVDLPHAEHVTRCGACAGRGRAECRKCAALGVVFCDACKNDGPEIFQGDWCIYCRRWGNGGLPASCDSCDGNRRVKCPRCEGHGRLKHRETVTVTWLTKVSEVADRDGEVPLAKLGEAEGHILLREESERLGPVTCPEAPLFGPKSRLLLGEHRGAFPHVLKQRHSVRVVPVTVASYSWRGRKGEFYVYGVDERVHFDRYPDRWTPCALV